MIELYTIDNTAGASYFTYDFDRLLPGKEEQEQWRNNIKGAAFYFLEEEDESREFKVFFRQSVENLMENYRFFLSAWKRSQAPEAAFALTVRRFAPVKKNLARRIFSMWKWR